MRIRLRSVTLGVFSCACLAWVLLHSTTRKQEESRPRNQKLQTLDGVAVPINQSFFMPHSPLTQSWTSSNTATGTSTSSTIGPRQYYSSSLPLDNSGSSSSSSSSSTTTTTQIVRRSINNNIFFLEKV